MDDSFKKANIYSITAAVKATITWKKQVQNLLNMPNAPLHHHLNAYGTADAGLLAYETTTSIDLLQLANNNKKFRDFLLKDLARDRPFAIFQYDPELIQLYVNDQHEILIDAPDMVVPLKAYEIKDLGRIVETQAIINYLEQHKLLSPELRDQLNAAPLPFLVFMGREVIQLVYNSSFRIMPDLIVESIQQIDPTHQLFTANFLCYIRTNDLIDTLVVELETTGDPTILQLDKLTQQFVAAMANCHADVNDAVQADKFQLQLKGIPNGEFYKRNQALKTQKVDAIFKETDKKARYLLLR